MFLTITFHFDNVDVNSAHWFSWCRHETVCWTANIMVTCISTINHCYYLIKDFILFNVLHTCSWINVVHSFIFLFSYSFTFYHSSVKFFQVWANNSLVIHMVAVLLRGNVLTFENWVFFTRAPKITFKNRIKASWSVISFTILVS